MDVIGRDENIFRFLITKTISRNIIENVLKTLK